MSSVQVSAAKPRPWDEQVPTPATLEDALDGREAAELLASLPERQARYLAIFAAG